MENYVYKYSDINEETQEVVNFGLEMLKESLLALLIALGLSVIFKMFTEAMLFLVILIPLRQNAGGYHAKYKTACALLSAIIFLLALLIIKNVIMNSMIQVVVCALSAFVIFCLSPVDNINNALDEIEILE